jgi:hypothetical protein
LLRSNGDLPEVTIVLRTQFLSMHRLSKRARHVDAQKKQERAMSRLTLVTLLPLALAFAGTGCSASTTSGAEDDSSAVTAADRADVECFVILRTASIDFTQTAGENVPWFKLTAEIDVLDGPRAAGAKPRLLWIDQSGKARSTTSTDGAPQEIEGAAPGYQRYRMEITHDTIATGDETLIASSRVSILPFLREADGTRLFDHNRVTGRFDTYTLWSGDTAGGLVSPPPNNPEIGAGFQVRNAEGVCTHVPMPNG